MMMHYGDYSEHVDHWHPSQQDPGSNPPPQQQQQQQHIHGPSAAPAGDSWV